MPRRAAWTAQLICDGCTYLTPLEAGSTRECPACGGFLRMELKRREVPNPLPPARNVAATATQRRSGWRGPDDSRS